MTYSASVELLCEHVGIIRLHEGDGGVVGDPYVWCCTYLRIANMAVLKGVIGSPTKDGAKAVIAALRGQGVVGRIHARRTPDGIRLIDKGISRD